SIDLILGPAVFDRHGLAFDMAGVLEALPKCSQTVRQPVRRSAVKESNHRHHWLLRARRDRPRSRRAAEQRDELAPFQLIELHSVPTSQGRITGYRIGEDQSGGNETILQSVGRSLSSRWYCSILFPRKICLPPVSSTDVQISLPNCR